RQVGTERKQRLARRDALRLEAKPRARRVMGGEPAGRDWRLSIPNIQPLRERSPERAFDIRPRKAAGTQQHRLAEAGDDGRFDPDRGRPAVEDEVDAAA